MKPFNAGPSVLLPFAIHKPGSDRIDLDPCRDVQLEHLNLIGPDSRDRHIIGMKGT